MSAELRRAVEILRAGGLVAFPTETVYGLGADASNERAVARLYAVKRRPADHPVIVHFASTEKAFTWGKDISDFARRLAARFWPGPLTLILKRSSLAKDFITGAQDCVGLRVPSHPVAHEMLAAFGGGVAAPSANRFGMVSPTTAQHVRDDLGGEVDLVLDGGPSEVGIESTIVDVTAEPAVLLRPGFISKLQLENALNSKILEKSPDSPPHPGGLERHYAPKTPVKLVASFELDQELSRAKTSTAVLAFSRPDERVDCWIRMPREPGEYARRLYAALRELDGAGCAAILIEAPPEDPGWQAVRDRLLRAAGER